MSLELSIESSPKVSIGVPVYNGEGYVKGAIDSLLAQTFDDFELIISDNASTDNTEQICRDYAERDPRIRYIRQSENIGPGANFKFVLDQAVGRYFMWAAADDRREPCFLEMTVRVLEEDPRVGLAFSDIILKNLETNEAVKTPVGYSGSNRKSRRYHFRLKHSCPNLIYGLHRIELVRQIGVQNYDYFDVHLTHWYELNSMIKTIPLFLFIAGIKARRIPYSVTGGLLDSSQFLQAEWHLLRENLPLARALGFFLMTWNLTRKSVKRLNRLIRAHLN